MTHIHTGDARVSACAHVGAVSAAVEWPEGREEAWPAAMRPGGGSARGPEAAGRKQRPQPSGREKAGPAAMRPGGRSARGPEAVGKKQRPQPSGREKAAPAAMRPGGRSARSHAAAGRKQHPQLGGRAGTEYAASELGGTAPAARRPGGDSARSSARSGYARDGCRVGGPGSRPHVNPVATRRAAVRSRRRSGRLCLGPGRDVRRYGRGLAAVVGGAKTQVEDVTVPC